METRKIQLYTRIWCAVFGVGGLLAGLVIGIMIGTKLNVTYSEPAIVSEYTPGINLEDGELTRLAYENYWNFIPTSYIMIGGDYEDAELYKISDKVERHDYDLERFSVGDDGYMHYSSDKVDDTLVGIDVSTFQGEIDWETLSKSKEIDFVILRVGYRGYGSGALDMDSSFETNKAAVKKYKINTGVYFFSQAINYDEGVEEAEYVLSEIKGMNIKYPVIIDTEQVEAENARGNDISVEERTDGIVGFCETIKEAGYTPMIYASRNWFAQSLDMDRLGEYELWLAHYSNVPNFPYKFRGWQYTSEGTVPGIEGEVDVNLWFK